MYLIVIFFCDTRLESPTVINNELQKRIRKKIPLRISPVFSGNLSVKTEYPGSGIEQNRAVH
ncbi:MAG: hypothetical protein D3914_03445 [Candidatus Electrothrix sp. LOE2]|jgi:hypothetical protein|nr:hypothetical protein [Candidatus Electrothrix sp. LOE2]